MKKFCAMLAFLILGILSFASAESQNIVFNKFAISKDSVAADGGNGLLLGPSPVSQDMMIFVPPEAPATDVVALTGAYAKLGKRTSCSQWGSPLLPGTTDGVLDFLCRNLPLMVWDCFC